MKRTFFALLISHAVAVAVSLLGNPSIINMLYIYVAQTAIFMLVVEFDNIRLNHWPQKLFNLFEVFFFTPFIAGAVFIIWSLTQSDTVLVNGVEKQIDLGAVSTVAIAIGAAAFLIDYIKSPTRKLITSDMGSFKRGLLSYLRVFVRIAALILIIFIAVSFDNSKIAILLIGAIKLAIDVGGELLDKAILKIPRIPEFSFKQSKV